MARRRSRSSNLWLMIPLGLLALLAAAGLAAFAFIDPNSFKPRLIEAVHAATGRDLVLGGPITVAFSLQLTLRATDVSLSNPPGFSRPQMATLARVEAQLALWPLLQGRIELVRLALARPDISLETNAAGQTNWILTRDNKNNISATPGVAASPSAAAQPPRFNIEAVQIDGGRLTWIDTPAGRTQLVDIHDLAAKTTSPGGPISATANLAVGEHKIALTAETGPLDSLLGSPASASASAAGWPVQLVARVEGTRLALSGTIAEPLAGRGYQLSLDATVPDLAAAGDMLGHALPGLRDVAASAKISDASGRPAPTAITLHAGASDLAAVTPGLSLDHLDLAAPGLDQPMHGDVAGMLSGQKLRLTADVGALSLLLPGARPAAVPFPINLSAQAAGASFTAHGSIANPTGLSGLNLVVSARVPDLAALTPLSGQTLPALHDLAFDGHVADGEGGYAKTIVLRGLSLTGPDGDLAGDLSIGLHPRLAITGQLAGQKLDLDSLLKALATPASPPTASASPLATARPALGPRRMIPDTAFNLAPLQRADADLTLKLGEIHSGGVVYRDLAGHVVLDHGKLSLDPFAATLPGGKLEFRLLLDSAATPPALTLALSAPGLALKPLLTALHQPDDVTGTVELAADVTAQGNSPHQMAATLSGKIGVAMAGGELDNVLLGRTAGTVLRAANLPNALFGGLSGAGRTQIRCAAIRLDATKGEASVTALVLDTPRALVQGTGAVNLDTEMLAMRLRPMLRTGGPGIVVPVQLYGPIDAPSGKVDRGGAIQGTATGLASGLLGNLAGLVKNPARTLASAFAGEHGGDACGPAIAAARAARPVLKP